VATHSRPAHSSERNDGAPPWTINQAFREARDLISEIEGNELTALPSPPRHSRWLAQLLEVLILDGPRDEIGGAGPSNPRPHLRIVQNKKRPAVASGAPERESGG
jgi:hypothetical protein